MTVPPAAHPAAAEPAAAAAPSTRGRTRRWVLGGAAAVLLGGGVGVAAGFIETSDRRTRPARPPAGLTEALAAERRLLAQVEATLGAHPELASPLAQLRRDHQAHAAALTNALRAYREGPSTSSASASASSAPVAALDGAGIAAAESTAAGVAARQAAALTGSVAALLASISACEATHAELLG